MLVVVLLVVVAVVALLAGVHWYVWRRLVRDTTARGGVARRVGTAAMWVLPLLSVAALVSGRAGAPFWLERVVAWPGYLWLAVLLYLVLGLVVGELVRPLLLRLGGVSSPAPPLPETGGQGPRTAEPSLPAHSAAGSADAVGRTPVGADAHTGAARTDAASVGTAPAEARTGATATAPAGATRTDATEASAGAARTDAAAGPGAGGQRTLSRRLFVSRVVGGAAAAVALGTVAHGTYGVLRGPRVKRVTVPLARLPRAAHGFRIAVVSDIHLGPILGRGHTQRIVDTINATSPDLVAVVGDLVDGSVADLGPAAEPLARLTSRYGSFFVTGNHEYFSGAEAWVDHVRELGLRPLQNERVEIGGFDLAGVNDVAGESEGDGPDFGKALGDRDRSRASVLLAHQPVVIHDAVEHGVDLQLSGHTHGGQLWPGNYLAALANPTVAGLERYGDTQLYVSRGAGAWGPPVRVGAPSDITVVQLASRHA
ncbi:metallophosphoesterase [Streptomyces sp. NBC_00322]|uniref:metallophosphoesterase n=1 Tax=Streptomyces sp. NBC_00322 TaxID=2975712 RepID=UPI002E2DBE00|nr:metallophosphoesterase [Streptomyces sp. NBC_00322]